MAAVLFISNLLTVLLSFSGTRWLMGGLDAPSYATLLSLTSILSPVCLAVFLYSGQWNVLAVGKTWAATRGLSTSRLLLTGAGLIVPCSFLIGGAFVCLADLCSRTLLAPVEIPVGVITAMLGGPVFIWMLRGYRGGYRGQSL